MTPDQALSDDALGALLRRANAELPDAPAHLLQAAMALWPLAGLAAQPQATLSARGGLAGALTAAVSGAVSGAMADAVAAVRQVAAVLRFDSWATAPLAAGMRGTGSAPRQLLFSAEGRDIDLRIAPAAGSAWVLDGQVLGPDERCAIALAPEGGGVPQHQALVDALGEFHLEGVSAGRWHLSLTLADQVIVLPSIELGARPA